MDDVIKKPSMKLDSGQMVEGIITALLKTPGIRVSREDFLISKFVKLVDEEKLNKIVRNGPHAAGIKGQRSTILQNQL